MDRFTSMYKHEALTIMVQEKISSQPLVKALYSPAFKETGIPPSHKNEGLMNESGVTFLSSQLIADLSY